MEQYRTEEEQIAAIKKWWADNGKSTVTGIVVAIALVFGWKAYQNSVAQTKGAASALYQNMLESALVQEPTAETISSVNFVANKLKTEFADSEYAIYASLFVAKNAVDEGKYDEAEKEFNWALSKGPVEEIALIINARLAKVKSAKGDIDGALALLNKPVPESVAPLYNEIKGDVLLLKGDKEAAREAYVEAAKSQHISQMQRPLLGMKLAELGVRLEDI